MRRALRRCCAFPPAASLVGDDGVLGVLCASSPPAIRGDMSICRRRSDCLSLGNLAGSLCDELAKLKLCVRTSRCWANSPLTEEYEYAGNLAN